MTTTNEDRKFVQEMANINRLLSDAEPKIRALSLIQTGKFAAVKKMASEFEDDYKRMYAKWHRVRTALDKIAFN